MAKCVGGKCGDLGSILGPSAFFVLVFLYISGVALIQTPTICHHHPTNGCVSCLDSTPINERPWCINSKEQYRISSMGLGFNLLGLTIQQHPPPPLISSANRPNLIFFYYFSYLFCFFYYLFSQINSFFINYKNQKITKNTQKSFFHKIVIFLN